MSITPKIFVTEASNLTHIRTLVPYIYTQIVWAISYKTLSDGHICSPFATFMLITLELQTIHTHAPLYCT